ncbi:MAG: peptide chain release factor N(5)-glutamine methyltransferase [Actinobacteria bacterium]|uniref:peptide chain release factor N(5)-glutamine methyltransferase n=1 Tax=freshwater metagenome TaxID=449393 RepID=A0A6J6JDH4_9ZZZZ|nr:peptide chain release factor N(5)-glutamine methyltransferase [Actinomycetota bacterium]
MNFKEFLAAGKEQLNAAGIDPLDAEHLMAYVLGISRMDLHNPVIVEDRLAGFEDLTILEETFWKLLDARAAHEPLQYLTGVAHFRYLDIQVGPGVLVPRPESELLVQSVLDHCEKISGIISVVDLGSGSGALALAISTENSNTRVIAVEKDPAAIEWLKKNVSQINEQVRIVESDVVNALEGVSCDVVIANPPYVPDNQELPRDVADHEPSIALFGGPTGLDIPGRFIDTAARLLKSGGFFALEHTEDQGPAIASLLEENFADIVLHRDLTQRPRFTTAIRR